MAKFESWYDIALASRRFKVIFWNIIGLTLAVIFLVMRNFPIVCDEYFHVWQIARIMDGDYRLLPSLTVPPTYHIFIAWLLKLTGSHTLSDLRFVSLLGSVVGIWFFYRLAERLWPNEKFVRTAQFVFLPILFPFHFLVYTDTWSLMAVLVALDRCLSEKVYMSALASVCAIMIRPPNAVWVGFIFLLFLFRDRQLLIYSWMDLKGRLFRLWPFVLLLLAFTVFVVANNGVAVGDRASQRFFFNIANTWSFLLILPWMFSPNVIIEFRELISNIARRPITITFWIIAFGALFYNTYHITHEYNRPRFSFFLRNRLLTWTTSIWWAEALALGVVILGLVVFIRTPLAERRFRLLIPIALFSTCLFPVIEQRYYLVPLSLFLLMRRSSAWVGEVCILATYICLSAVFMTGILNRWFFL